MSETLMEVNVRRSSAPVEQQIESHARTNAVSEPPESRAPAMPFSVPRAQLYYWTARWQSEERAALDELGRGEGREFDTATDAIKWLLDPED